VAINRVGGGATRTESTCAEPDVPSLGLLLLVLALVPLVRVELWFTWPNLITLTRLCMSISVALCGSPEYGALLGAECDQLSPMQLLLLGAAFVAMDFADGALARKLGQVLPAGASRGHSHAPAHTPSRVHPPLADKRA
jgi:hypothetical protein